MIVGVGIDLVNVERIQRVMENPKTGGRFRERVYTEREVEYCEAHRRKYESYAGRFAAKEAVMKGLRTGWSQQLGWLDIEVVNGAAGEPRVHLHRGASELACSMGVRHFSLSITHTQSYAMATLIAEGEG